MSANYGEESMMVRKEFVDDLRGFLKDTIHDIESGELNSTLSEEITSWLEKSECVIVGWRKNEDEPDTVSIHRDRI